MKRITYTSTFVDPVDLLLIDSLGVNPQDSYAACYDASGIDAHLEHDAQAMCEILQLKDFATLIEEDRKKLEQPNRSRLYYVLSAVGDDEHTTTDSSAMGPIIITVGPRLSKIKLSRKDTGISKNLGNYAEGWILVPPTAESSFEAVNRRHLRDGVPIVLDGLKLKLISPVRKMSKLEMDLESKMLRIAESAGWVNRLWFTYDYHQMALLLAQNVFDFRDARSFPYLHSTEGGCGGQPPYSNLDTAISAIHAFHRGKARRTILGIAYEAVACHYGEMQPNETFFIRSSHIAQMGDSSWLKYDQVYRALLKGTDATEAKEKLATLAGKSQLPRELLDKGVELSPDDIRIGTAISHLRRDGFVLTEMDVKMMLENRKKIEALGGTRPFKEVLAEIEEEKNSIKSNSWKVLGELATLYGPEDYRSMVAIQDMPDYRQDVEKAREILMRYYALRSEHYADFTSFAYADAIRIFKTSDVEDYIQRSGNVLRAEIALQVSAPVGLRFATDIVAERQRKERILSWIESADLREILMNPLPPGVGPDDPRIIHAFLDVLSMQPENERDPVPLVYILVSGDRKLSRSMFQYGQEIAGKSKWVILTIEPVQYIAICLLHARASNDNEPWTKRKPQSFSVWNFITEEYIDLPPQVHSSIKDTVRMMGARSFHAVVEYDYPNIERQLELMESRNGTNTISLQRGGYLRSATLASMPTRSCWSEHPLEYLYSWPDFDRNSKLVFPLPRNHRVASMINNPRRPDFYRSISSWSRRTQSNVLSQDL